VISSIQIIYASSSGHTEYVVQVLAKYLKGSNPDLNVTLTRAEQAQPDDLVNGDCLILASGTWNTGGVEGQLNVHMDDLLKNRAKGVDLKGKKVAFIALGDHRYYYTARSGEHMRQFVMTHGGEPFGIPLTVIDEPFGQEERVEKWGEKFISQLTAS
jgi:flavodoxin